MTPTPPQPDLQEGPEGDRRVCVAAGIEAIDVSFIVEWKASSGEPCDVTFSRESSADNWIATIKRNMGQEASIRRVEIYPPVTTDVGETLRVARGLGSVGLRTYRDGTERGWACRIDFGNVSFAPIDKPALAVARAIWEACKGRGNK